MERLRKADEITLTPLELIDRIAALVPPPRRLRHRDFGVLAPNSPLLAAFDRALHAAMPVDEFMDSLVYHVNFHHAKPAKIMSNREDVMLKAVGWIEKFIVQVLVVLLLITIVMGTLELGSTVVAEVVEPPYFQIETSRLFEMFSIFLIVLVGLELLRSVKSYFVHGEIKPEIVVQAAIIAVGNKLITLDIKHISSELLIGLSAVLLGLAVLYYVLRKTDPP